MFLQRLEYHAPKETGPAVRCRHCQRPNTRWAKFHLGDLPLLLLLFRYPRRCRDCHHRWHHSMLLFLWRSRR